jgi:hypothetical protein
MQNVPRGRFNILGGYSTGNSKQKSVYVHVSYSERFPRYSYFTVQYTVHCTDEQHAMSSHELHQDTAISLHNTLYTVQTSNTPCPYTSCKVS